MEHAGGSGPARLPRGVARGTLRPPGSKSLAIRALVCAGLTGGTTRVVGLSDGEDVAAALALLEGVGARTRRVAPAAVALEGRPPGPHRGWRPAAGVDVGESGTLARIATAALAFCGDPGREVEVRARGSLLARESAPLFAALERSGVEVRHPPGSGRRGWPVLLKPLGPPPDLHLEEPRSSQEASALLVALSAFPGESAVHVRGEIPSRPYLDMTIGVLAAFGASVLRDGDDGGERFLVRGPLRAPDAPFVVEPDASAAAVALAAACLSGGEVEIPDLGRGSLQGDLCIVEHLRAFGCEAELGERAVYARGRPTRGARIDLASAPDLAPVLAALAAHAAFEGRASLLEGLGTLEGKESPRLSVLAGALRRLGLDARTGSDWLAVAPPSARLPQKSTPVVLDPRNDHRMAFAFTLFGVGREDVFVADPQCVAKSWPSYWRDMERLLL